MQNYENKQVPLIWIRPRASRSSLAIIPTCFLFASRQVRAEERCTRHFSSLLASQYWNQHGSSDRQIAALKLPEDSARDPSFLQYTFLVEKRQKHGVSRNCHHVPRGCNAGRHHSLAGGRRTEM
jgi:hypothetical protein